MLRINLISGPRNISTALMYSFAQRTDTQVLDEPYYAVYLSQSKADHPAKSEILQLLPAAEEEVDRMIFSYKPGFDVLFIKNMAHHIQVLREEIKPGLTNLFLIRDPERIIASYAQVRHHPSMEDIGIKHQYHLFNRLSAAEREVPTVIDAGVLLENPVAVLKLLCKRLSIGFMPEMLSWKTGPKTYDGVWAPFWYHAVHNSTGFVSPTSKRLPVPDHLVPLYKEADSYYQKLLPFALKP